MIATRPSLASGLHWVRPEIEACLQRVRTQLENAMESADERAGLLAAVAELRQRTGGLDVVVEVRALVDVLAPDHVLDAFQAVDASE